jgi:hypothetical protein
MHNRRRLSCIHIGVIVNDQHCPRNQAWLGRQVAKLELGPARQRGNRDRDNLGEDRIPLLFADDGGSRRIP